MIILLNTVKTIGHGIFKITNRAVKLILLRRISFAIHKHKPKEEKHCSTARQLFRPRLISSVTRNNWRENANPDFLLKDGYLSLDETKSRKSNASERSLKIVYERFWLQRFDWENFGVFGQVGAYLRWSPTRGGRTWRFGCIFLLIRSLIRIRWHNITWTLWSLEIQL